MKQQSLLGFLFALITAMAWGSLPIALKQVLSVMTPQTIVLYRFIVAFLALFILLSYKKKLPQFFKGGRFIWLVLKGESGYLTGVLLSLTASLVWVAYGMAQKLMLRRFSSQQVLLMMYFGCLLVFTPVAEFSQVSNLTPFAFGCFVYCCLNTLFGYGAYAEALNRWEVSKVSVVITLVPLFTIFFAHLAHYASPDNFAAPELNMISYIGAFVVVCGAILSAIGHKLLPQSK